MMSGHQHEADLLASGGVPGTDLANPPDTIEDFDVVGVITRAEALSRTGDLATALELYERWLQRHPSDPLRHAVYFNYGTLLSDKGYVEQAAAALSEAVRIAPKFLPPYINAGLAFERLGRYDQAVDYWLQLIGLVVPVEGDAIANVTMALRHLARLFKAIAEYPRAEEALRRNIDIDPHQRDVIQHWVAVREMQCKWPVIAPCGRLTQAAVMAALSPLALAIHTNDPIYQLANAWRTFEQDVAPSLKPYTAGRWIPPESAPFPNRPLRIGYVSPDLREHAVGFLTAELFELHDRSKVEVFAYFSGPGGPDALQARIQQNVDHWRTIVGWPDRQVARQIINDGIDILVDLGGHTGHVPSGTFALRPAPVIVNWLGYPGSMGTPHHQYIIADEAIIPPSHEKFYSERVVRLPCYQPTDRKRVVGQPPSRREAGLPDEALVFCCFNGTQKITPAMFGCWMTILIRVPDGILWLLSCDAATDERLRHQAASQGVSPQRLVFAVRKPNAEHLARYGLADLFLDTSPYGAHTTASDALWMGVPVLTLAGHSFASRVCASLVQAAGLPELVCYDTTTYIDRAVQLASDAGMLRTLHGRLQIGRSQCTLFDMPLLVLRLETLYAQMWEEFLSGCIPEPDLRNLALYAEIGTERDHTMEDFPSLFNYEQEYATTLAYRHSISPVTSDNRLWNL